MLQEATPLKKYPKTQPAAGAQHTGHPFFMITRGLFRPGFLEALIVLPRLAMSFLIKEYLFKK